jgi:hypothetical protein
MEVSTVIVRYVLGVDNAYACQRGLNEAVEFSSLPFSAKDFRLEVVSKAYLTLNLKMFVFNMLIRPVSSTSLQDEADRFNIDRNDVVLVRKTLEHKSLRRLLRKTPRFKEARDCQVELMEISDVTHKFDTMFDDLKRHVRNKAYRKLRFLARAENTEFSDFEGDLICKALRAYYMMVPSSKKDAHILNSLRLTCTNHALNIIESQTTEKRNRLINAGSDGFGGVAYLLQCSSENQLMADESGVANFDNSLNEYNENNGIFDTIQLESVLRNYGTSSKRTRILHIVTGAADTKFTEYLREAEVIKEDEDSSDFVARTQLKSISKHLGKHLEVRPSHVRTFLRRVARDLLDVRSVE